MVLNLTVNYQLSTVNCKLYFGGGFVKEITGGITAAEDFLTAGIRTGIKEEGLDLGVIYSNHLANVGAVFTTNQAAAAPVKISRDACDNGLAQALVVNSGNANACTGEQGYQDGKKMAKLTAEELELDIKEVLVASTGIIGELLAMDKIESGIKKACNSLGKDKNESLARAIMTTDTYKKERAVEIELAGKKVKLGAVAKGSGMIEPNMATMLSFITTDAAITSELLQQALTEAVGESFNKITVDGDQSTNDTVTVMANGSAGNDLIVKRNQAFEKFLEALKYLCKELAKDIVKDGEGANKFVTVKVTGAKTKKQAAKVARKVANSNLFKTALFGEDVNWGRIVAAAGASGVEFELDLLEIALNGVAILTKGQQEANNMQQLEEEIKEDELIFEINLNSGDKSNKIWTCDLSYKYVEINAEYHT